MPTIPVKRTLEAKTLDILNAIRNSASVTYRNYVPAITDEEDLRAIGNIIMQHTALQNEFLSALVNRISRVIITSKLYDNPWAVFKRGILNVGETTEEIFVNIASVFEYDPERAESEVFKRVFPDVRAAFHTLNFKKFYKVTIQEGDLALAFTSMGGVTDLIARIVDSIYTAANYDEFLAMKYLLARYVLDGRMLPITVGASSAENAHAIITAVKAASNKLTFLNSANNPAGVYNHTPKESQYVILNSDFDAIMDVNVLAGAFNMSKADFMGRRMLVDSFGALDRDRLDELFAEQPGYRPITAEEAEALDTIPLMIVDRDFWQVYDNMLKFAENYNGQGDYWNYFYHVWKTLSVSPFAQAILFVPTEPTVTGITVSPTALSMGIGSSASITVSVESEGFAPKTVSFTSSDEGVATVDALGVVTGVSAGTATIAVTSTFDSEQSEEVSVTVTA